MGAADAPGRALKGASAFLQLTDTLQEKEAAARITPLLERYRLGLFRLVVVGEIKKGKSSFINALLGEKELVPTSNDVSTSTVYKIMYGERKAYRVFFQPEDPEKPDVLSPPLEIGPERVAEFGTENGNPGNTKRVDFIGVQLPSPLLKSGLVIIDTPGLGGLFREHADITWRYVPNADAIFFVLDSIEAVISQDEVNAIASFVKITPYIFFVQSKTDLVDESIWRQWRERNLAAIGGAMKLDPEKVIYFPISSQVKMRADAKKSGRDLKRSGFPPLLGFLHSSLMEVKKRKLGQGLLQSIAVELAAMRRRFSEELRILSAETKEALAALEGELMESKARFEEWRANSYVQAVSDFQQALADLKRDTINCFQTDLDPSPNGPLIRPVIDRLREVAVKARDMNQQARDIHGQFIEHCGERVFEIQREYGEEFQNLVAATTDKIGRSMRIELGGSLQSTAIAEVERLNMTFSLFEDARNVMYGGIAGGMMASILTGLVFPPLSLPAILVGLGFMVGGGFHTYRAAEERRREEALTKLQGVLVDACRISQRQAIKSFGDITAAAERKAAAAFKEAGGAVEAELRKNLDLVADARKNRREQSQARLEHLRGLLSKVDAVLQLVGPTPAGMDRADAAAPAAA